MEKRIVKVMAEVLMVDEDCINGESSPENIEEWDSLKQMNLIMAFEEEFEIQLSDEDVVEMLNFQLIKNIIYEYVGERK